MQNIGLQAKILSQRTFTIFVVMALITTFATTPLTTALYPLAYQRKLEAWRQGKIDWDGNRLDRDDDEKSETDRGSIEKMPQREIRRLLVYLRLDNLPGLFTFVTLLGPNFIGLNKAHPRRAAERDNVSETETISGDAPYMAKRRRPFQVHGVRLVELTERTSSVMRGSEMDEHAATDPVVNVFRTFGQLNSLAVSGNVSVAPEHSYAETLSFAASDRSSDFLLIPWGAAGSVTDRGLSRLHAGMDEHQFNSGTHNQFIMDSFKNAVCDVGAFVNRGFGGMSGSAPVQEHTHHVFFPFFGGADDRAALHFVLQLAQNPNVTATILYVDHEGRGISHALPAPADEPVASATWEKTPTEVHAVREEVSGEAERDFFNATRESSLAGGLESRVYFDELSAHRPLAEAVARARAEVGQSLNNAGDLIVAGRSTAAGRDFSGELRALLSPGGAAASPETWKTLGDVAEAMFRSDVNASVLVIQAGGQAKLTA